MLLSRETILSALSAIQDPLTDKDLVSAGLIKSLNIKSEEISFLIEIDPTKEDKYRETQKLAQTAIEQLKDGLKVKIFLTAHRNNEESSQTEKAPNLKIGRHPEAQTKKIKPAGVNKIIAIGS